MADKVELIRNEIERRKERLRPFVGLGSDTCGRIIKHFDAILDFIDSLQEKPVSEDLGEYINELSKQFPEVSFAKLSRIAVRVAKWQEEQLTKNAIEATVKVDAGGYPYVDKHIELYDYDKDELWANSYPSGHSAGIMSCCLLLIELLPKQTDKILAAANSFAVNRTTARYHWNSDTIQGRVLATCIAPIIRCCSDWNERFEKAKECLKK